MPFFAPPPPPPVSFTREVAPILAMRCNSCHGDAGGLSTRTHASLMAGGNLGKVVVPGDGERSLLVHFIDGRRGEAHRMPLGGRPLSTEEIGTVKKWIDEGARLDSASQAPQVFKLGRVALPRGKPLRLYCRVSTDAYLTVNVRDPRNGRVLLSWVAAVKGNREEADAGSPGETLHWDIRSGNGWPKSVDAELTVEYAAKPVPDTAFYTDAGAP